MIFGDDCRKSPKIIFPESSEIVPNDSGCLKNLPKRKKKQVFMASLEMINSLWYNQTPKRVDYLINILLKRYDEKKEK